MASRFEVMQDIEVLEQEMNRMSKELCDNIKSIINNEYDNDELFSTINLEYEHIEKIRRKIHRIQQMIFGFSSQTQNIFDGNSPNVEDCASTTNRSSENDTDKAAESVNNDCQITISSATTPALSPPHQTDLKGKKCNHVLLSYLQSLKHKTTMKNPSTRRVGVMPLQITLTTCLTGFLAHVNF